MATMPRAFECSELLAGAMEIEIGDQLQFNIEVSEDAAKSVAFELKSAGIEVIETESLNNITYFTVKISRQEDIEFLGRFPPILYFFYVDFRSHNNGFASRNLMLDPDDDE